MTDHYWSPVIDADTYNHIHNCRQPQQLRLHQHSGGYRYSECGDIIEVHSGMYYENVDVDKRFILGGVDTVGGMLVGAAAVISI